MDAAAQAELDNSRRETTAQLLTLGGVTPRAYMQAAPTSEIINTGAQLYAKGEIELVRLYFGYLMSERVEELQVTKEESAVTEILRRSERLHAMTTPELLIESRRYSGSDPSVFLDGEALLRYMINDRSVELPTIEKAPIYFQLGYLTSLRIVKELSAEGFMAVESDEPFENERGVKVDSIAFHKREVKDFYLAAVELYRASDATDRFRGVFAYFNLTNILLRVHDRSEARSMASAGVEYCRYLEQEGLDPKSSPAVERYQAVRADLQMRAR